MRLLEEEKKYCIVRTRYAEKDERNARSDPSDGLRPLIKLRKKL